MVKPAPDSFNPELVARRSPLRDSRRRVNSEGNSVADPEGNSVADGGSGKPESRLGAERLSVAFPLSHCKRLVELLASDEGTLKGEFEVIRYGHQITVAGHFETGFMLECQRCLHQYEQAVAANFAFVLVPDQAAADALPEEQDPLIVGEDGMIHVVDIFEDELILHLPAVPRHTEVENCTFDVTVDIQAGEKQPGTEEEAGRSGASPEGGLASDKPESGVQRGTDVFAALKNLRFDKE